MKTLRHRRRALGGQQFPDYRAVEADYYAQLAILHEAREAHHTAVRLAKYSAERLTMAEQIYGGVDRDYAKRALAEYDITHQKDVIYQHICEYELRCAERKFADAKRAFMRREFYGVRTAPARRRRPARGAERRAAIEEPRDGIDYPSACAFIATIFAAAALMRDQWRDILDYNYMLEIERSYAVD